MPLTDDAKMKIIKDVFKQLEGLGVYLTTNTDDEITAEVIGDEYSVTYEVIPAYIPGTFYVSSMARRKKEEENG